MKTLMHSYIISLLSIFVLTSELFAYGDALQVGPAQWTWSRDQGTIEKAFISVRPQGAYIEYGLYLTFSARNTGYDSPFETDLEISLNFDLPKSSMVTDSWLWVNNQIMKAIIIERGQASAIYEGFINRQTDPSILYKNTDCTYQLRVYPLTGTGERKVKISYLVPAHWSNNRVTAPLPIDLLQASSDIPNLELLIHTSAQFHSPVISELEMLPNSTVHLNNTVESLIQSYVMESYEGLSISYTAAYTNGSFFNHYATTATEGYYQLVVHPQKLSSGVPGRKLLVLMDYHNNSKTSLLEVLAKTKEMLTEYLAPSDSFNVFFSSTSINKIHSGWLPADDLTMQSVFAGLLPNWTSDEELLDDLVVAGIEYIQANGGEVIFLTDFMHQYSYNNNAILSAIQLAQNPTVPINVVNFNPVNNYTSYYLHEPMALNSGGNYFHHEWRNSGGNWSSTYLQITRFDELMRDCFSSTAPSLDFYQVNVNVANGVSYAEYEVSAGPVQSMNRPYVEIGKYFGSPSFDIQYVQLAGSAFQVSNHAVVLPVVADSMNKKIWNGLHIANLESASSFSSVAQEIIDSSRANRVLSLNTAFLALEPNDTLPPCVDCDDESNPGGNTGLNEQDESLVAFTASPNPFDEFVLFEFSLEGGLELVDNKIRIFNLSGQLIAEIEIPTGQANYEIKWDATALQPGIYFASLETTEGKYTFKLVKE